MPTRGQRAHFSVFYQNFPGISPNFMAFAAADFAGSATPKARLRPY
jgi:hypothetical protein